MRNIWFVSDMHIGHQNIIKYCGRPYASVDEMNRTLVDNWNAVVKKEDRVFCLGDMAFHNFDLLGELNGWKSLVPGNHDRGRAKKVMPYFEVLDEVHYLKISKTQRFVLCHYPFESWRREYKHHLHGHAHGTAGVKHNRLDVGIDATKLYRPVNLDEIESLMDTNNLWAMEMQK